MKGRVSVVQSVYYQRPGEQPEQVEARFSFAAESSEQKYGPREMRVGSAWAPVDSGWLKEASYIVVQNTEGTRQQLTPTDEERAAVSMRVVLLGIAHGDTVVAFTAVHPGCTERLRVMSLDSLRIRCASATAKVHVTTVPK